MAALFIQMILKCRHITAYRAMESTNSNSVIPDSLSLLLNKVLKSKATQTNQRRCTSVAHAIISIFFFSLILLAIAVCIYQKHASRELIDILNTLGFSDELQGGT